MRSLLLLALALALAAMVVAGCSSDSDNGASTGATDSGGTPVDGGSIVVGSARAHNTWDGAEADDVWDGKIQGTVVEPLIRQSTEPAGEPEPGIAESWELSPDARKLTVKIRDGVTFSDGTPLTAEDVVFSFKDAWKTDHNINAYLIRYAETAKASADGTSVTFTSSQPNGLLPYALSYGAFGVVPKDYAGKSRKEFFEKPIGAGAFTIASQQLGSAGFVETVLRRNENYYGEKAHLDEITLRTISDSNQLALQFESGELDVVSDIPPNLADRFDAEAVQYIPYGAMKSVFASWDSKPYVSQAKFRRALSLAIDREKLLDGYWGGHGTFPNRFSSETLENMPEVPEGDWRTYDPEEAKRLIEETGYDGRTLVLEINAEGQGHQVLSQALIQMFDEVGVKVKTRSNPDSTAFFMRLAGPTYTGGDYDLGLAGIEGGAMNPADIISAHDEFYWFGVGAPPAKAKEFRAAAVAAKTPEELRDIMSEVEQWAYDNVVMIPMAQPDQVFAIDPSVKGIKQNLVGVWRASDWYVAK